MRRIHVAVVATLITGLALFVIAIHDYHGIVKTVDEKHSLIAVWAPVAG